jgi:hypothetical protein
MTSVESFEASGYVPDLRTIVILDKFVRKSLPSFRCELNIPVPGAFPVGP